MSVKLSVDNQPSQGTRTINRNKMSYCVIIRGPLGVGKTTLAKALAKKLKAKYISVDKIVDGHGWNKDIAPDGYISEKSFLKANKIIMPIIEKQLTKGTITVVDGNFYRKSQLEDLLKKITTQTHVFTLKATLKECIKRDSKRSILLGKASTQVVYKAATKFDHGTIIDTNKKTIKQTLNEILNYLDKLKENIAENQPITKQEAIKTVKQFVNEVLLQEKWYRNVQKEVKAIVLYGSVAKGLNQANSDIDIYIILPLKTELKYTKGEYYYQYKQREINIVLRSIERMRKLAKHHNNAFEAEVLHKSEIIWEKDNEVRMLIENIQMAEKPK